MKDDIMLQTHHMLKQGVTLLRDIQEGMKQDIWKLAQRGAAQVRQAVAKSVRPSDTQPIGVEDAAETRSKEVGTGQVPEDETRVGEVHESRRGALTSEGDDR